HRGGGQVVRGGAPRVAPAARLVNVVEVNGDVRPPLPRPDAALPRRRRRRGAADHGARTVVPARARAVRGAARGGGARAPGVADGRMRGPVTMATMEGAGPLTLPWVWALLLTFSMVAAVAIHEAAHAVAARAAGGRVSEVTLVLLGGCARVGGLSSTGAQVA